MLISCERDPSSGILCIYLQQNVLDASNANDIRGVLKQALENEKAAIIDLSEVDFVDSSGLGVLLSCLRQSNEAEQELALCCLQTSVQSLFELVRMHRLFRIYSTKEQAQMALLA
jgi:anti-sigma B factor antagonist